MNSRKKKNTTPKNTLKQQQQIPKSIPSRGHMKATKQLVGALRGASTLKDPHVVILKGRIGTWCSSVSLKHNEYH